MHSVLLIAATAVVFSKLLLLLPLVLPWLRLLNPLGIPFGLSFAVLFDKGCSIVLEFLLSLIEWLFVDGTTYDAYACSFALNGINAYCYCYYCYCSFGILLSRSAGKYARMYKWKFSKNSSSADLIIIIPSTNNLSLSLNNLVVYLWWFFLRYLLSLHFFHWLDKFFFFALKLVTWIQIKKIINKDTKRPFSLLCSSY